MQNDEAEGGKPQRRRDCRDEVGPGILAYHIHRCFVNVFRDHFSFWSSNWANLTYVCQDYHQMLKTPNTFWDIKLLMEDGRHPAPVDR